MASFSVPSAKSSVLPPSSCSILNQNLKHNHFFGFQRSSQNTSRVLKLHAQVNEVVNKSLNSAAIVEITSEDPISEEKGRKRIPDPQSIAAFMNQVADLVELVDSRDIVELQLKQPECEVSIRKKEALMPQPPIAPVITMQAPPPPAMVPSPLPPPAQVTPPISSSPAASPSALEAAPAPPQPSKSSHPPLKCPMAGTFYRSPGPGAPPFVKVNP
ncbi:hypothetical protein DITRI_Ditri04bG0043300 [Diplodiscus trichospermus]